MSRPCLRVSILFYYLCIVKSQYDCTSDETSTLCTIIRATATDGQDITCSDATECNVQCNAADSCNTDIYCPPDGTKCTIDCNTHNACTSATIVSGNCDEVLVNINGHTEHMTLDTPGDSGSLSLHISDSTTFEYSTIRPSQNTHNILLNCEGDCSDNRIDASPITGVLNISCTDECESNVIHCPDTNECNIDCKDCIDTFIWTDSLSLMSWQCSRDCTNSSVSDYSNNIHSWNECDDEAWLLLPTDTQCPTTTTPSPDSEEALDSQQFTILAFVLIGTVIGCLCVIVVTTIICCICWHEHQIKALNMQHNSQTQNKNMPKPVDTNNPNNNPNNMAAVVNGHIQNHMTVNEDYTSNQRSVSSIPGSSEPSPVPQSVTISRTQENNGHNIGHINPPNGNGNGNGNDNIRVSNNSYISQPHSHASHSHSRKKRGTSNTSRHTEQNIQYTQPIQQQNPSYDTSESSHNNNPGQGQGQGQRQRQSNNSSHRKNSSKRGNSNKKQRKNTNNSRTNSNADYADNYAPHKSRKSNRSQASSHARRIDEQIQIEQQIAMQHNQEQNIRVTKKKPRQSYDEEAEAADDVFPLQNDRIGMHFNEAGVYDQYANRKDNKDAIKMQLAAFPSEISAGTTGTAEMNFVGSNYNQYNPMVNNNSYFGDDKFEPSPKNDALSLSDMDSGTTVTTVTSSIAMTPVTPNNMSPDVATFKQYQGHTQQKQQKQYGNHSHQYQGQNAQRQRGKGRRNKSPNNIKIIQPNQGRNKVKQQKYRANNRSKTTEDSPTLTYSSPTAEYQ